MLVASCCSHLLVVEDDWLDMKGIVEEMEGNAADDSVAHCSASLPLILFEIVGIFGIKKDQLSRLHFHYLQLL